MNKIIDTVLYWIFTFGVMGMFTYLIFWKGHSGWWYLVAVLFIGAVQTDVKERNKKENDNK